MATNPTYGLSSDANNRSSIAGARNGYLAVFSIKEGAVATSGDYINWFTEDKSSHPIIGPVSYQSPGELSSVTVHASSALESDALSTAIMVMGLEAGLKFTNELDRVEAFVVTKKIMIHRTNGFPHPPEAEKIYGKNKITIKFGR